MTLNLSNATITTRRDGVSGFVLSAIPAQVDPATYLSAPEGPRRIQEIYIDIGQDVAANDYVDVTLRSGKQKTGVIDFVDDVDDCDGDQAYTSLRVDGGLLPP